MIRQLISLDIPVFFASNESFEIFQVFSPIILINNLNGLQ